jgi:hypothetical protein
MKSLRKVLLGTLFIAATGSLLNAAPGDPAPGGDVVTESGTKQAEMTSAEMVGAADELVNGMHGMLRHVMQLREKASKEKDIIKLNCVNDKLVPMKAQVNLADASRRVLDQVIGANDDKGRYATYGDLVVSNDKVKELRDEADACVGDSLTYVGKTDVQVTGPDHPLLPGEDTGFGNGIEPPVYKTPFD